MDIPGTITAITASITALKGLREINAEYDKAELKAQLADVMSSLADAKIALSEAQEVIAGQSKEISVLKTTFEKSAKLVEHRGYKYETNEKGQPKGEPFCPRCEQRDGFLMRLSQSKGAVTELQCPECKSIYSRIPRFAY